MSMLRAAPTSIVRGIWNDAESYQRFLYVIGALRIGSGVFHTGVLVVTGGALDGDVSWRKPILFGEAFGFTAISIGWFMTFLPKHSRSGWLIAAPLGIANTGEVLWVSVQQWRGVPSHFNDATLLDEMLFLGAGILISIATAAIVGITVWSFRSMVGPLSLVLAIEAGLVLLIIGLAFGGIMIGNESNTVGEAGALKIPHALGIHAAQLLPLLGIGFRFTRLSESERVRVMIAGVVAYSAVVGATTYQALSGRALSDVSIGALVLVVVAMAACGLAAYRVWRGTTAEVASFERSAR